MKKKKETRSKLGLGRFLFSKTLYIFVFWLPDLITEHRFWHGMRCKFGIVLQRHAFLSTGFRQA
jgi:hypothetical protein